MKPIAYFVQPVTALGAYRGTPKQRALVAWAQSAGVTTCGLQAGERPEHENAYVLSADRLAESVLPPVPHRSWSDRIVADAIATRAVLGIRNRLLSVVIGPFNSGLRSRLGEVGADCVSILDGGSTSLQEFCRRAPEPLAEFDVKRLQLLPISILADWLEHELKRNPADATTRQRADELLKSEDEAWRAEHRNREIPATPVLCGALKRLANRKVNHA